MQTFPVAAPQQPKKLIIQTTSPTTKNAITIPYSWIVMSGNVVWTE